MRLETPKTFDHAPAEGGLRDGQTALSREIERKSRAEWGPQRTTVILGEHPSLLGALEKAVRFAPSRNPVLITGETGTGKELFARALYLSSVRHRKGLLTVNCAQYCGTELVASELFGHRRGSFTGATSDHRGVFEAGSGGAVFLDEIGDLPMQAQAMLLRVLGEGEVIPVGETRARAVDVRIFAATSRDLREMVDQGSFRADLYYRLRQHHVHVPAVRERGQDWLIIARRQLTSLNLAESTDKRFSEDAVDALQSHMWPGNVREVKSCVDTGFHLSRDGTITFSDLAEALEDASRGSQFSGVPISWATEACFRMMNGEQTFWDAIYRPFMDRELNRSQVRELIVYGLSLASGSYKKMLSTFGIESDDYLKFMDFLRNHRLKPTDRG